VSGTDCGWPTILAVAGLHRPGDSALVRVALLLHALPPRPHLVRVDALLGLGRSVPRCRADDHELQLRRGHGVHHRGDHRHRHDHAHGHRARGCPDGHQRSGRRDVDTQRPIDACAATWWRGSRRPARGRYGAAPTTTAPCRPTSGAAAPWATSRCPRCHEGPESGPGRFGPSGHREPRASRGQANSVSRF